MNRGTLVACSHTGCYASMAPGTLCVQFSNGIWSNISSSLQLRERSFFTSAVIGNFILLEGGTSFCTGTIYNSTTYVHGNGSDTFEGPPMTRGRAMHCSVQVDSSTIVLTGGVSSNINESISSVVQYSQVAVGNSPTSTKLPDLNRARANHACGCFKLPNGKNFEKV